MTISLPSHGKSNFTEWYVLNLVKDYNMKASFFSPEHSPMPLHKTTFIQKTFGKNFWKDYSDTPRISKDEIKKYKQWANEKIYLTGAENGEFPTWDWLIEKFKEQMYSFGIDIFIIDIDSSYKARFIINNRQFSVISIISLMGQSRE